MKRFFCSIAVAGAASCVAASADAAERIRPGTWEQTISIAGKSVTQSRCVSQSEADALNGDARSIRAYLENLAKQAGAPSICPVTDVKIDGNRVTVTKHCPDGREPVGTTTYHGDRYETVNNFGMNSQGRLIGPCK
jgi:hypothetical protein